MMEAIALCQEISGKKLNYEYVPKERAGDHIWWISSMAKFKQHYPQWCHTMDLEATLREIYEVQRTTV